MTAEPEGAAVPHAPVPAVLAPFRAGIERARRQLERDPGLAEAIARDAHAELVAEQRNNRVQGQMGPYLAHRPSEYAESSYARLRPEQDPEQRVSRWWASESKSLILAGMPGRGKTDAAYAICNEVTAAMLDGGPIVAVRTVRMVELRDLLVMVPAAHVQRDEQESLRRANRITSLHKADLLLVDDVTSGNVTGALQQALHGLIDARVSNGRRTIYTLNAPSRTEVGAALDGALGAAIVSRLRDRTVAAWIDGQDMRRHTPWNPFA